ncbi:Bug family tripartite tricarboxylate transporter substrate binding protein [Parapusillimonas granuli]|uniref:Tripartite tricarboxylate transporter substrate binding protein n=1 Tax=Parapusillimonas granuli TaxID=380911 RepID=A0A853FWQ0_9BURK|nr:tripartite tricarboxylate transporter substrate binding protein [Parapusillimonas granuli]MBB5216592.1 tripartite-type tricarboxylate transporter receptor subunit TctC [Parapusillimonas granuli]NYT48102.1 tripartite tricarboxylate transporter substrate binding protein [Parapusillimonas granuli]
MRHAHFIGKTLSALAFATCMIAPGIAQAADYPTRPVRLVVAYPPGGTTDTQARILAQKLSERWKQQVVVENKPGGNTVIATLQVANSAPDGYTLLMTAMPFALNPLVMDSLPYDTKKDLAPVTLLTSVPSVFIAHPDMKVKTVDEFIKKYKGGAEEPIPFGSAGTLTFTHLGGELFASQSGVKFQHVPYKGSSPAHQDLVAGRIKVMFDNGALELIKSGRVVALGVTSDKRLPWLPDVPTIAEQGFPGFQAAAWFGIFTKGGTPKEVIEKISQDITWAIRSPEVVEKLTASGVFPGGGTPQEFQAFLDSEVKRWGPIIKEKGIKIQ